MSLNLAPKASIFQLGLVVLAILLSLLVVEVGTPETSFRGLFQLQVSPTVFEVSISALTLFLGVLFCSFQSQEDLAEKKRKSTLRTRTAQWLGTTIWSLKGSKVRGLKQRTSLRRTSAQISPPASPSASHLCSPSPQSSLTAAGL